MNRGRLTLMAVHAHPDDEATGTGGLLARSAAEGIETVLVTCTDGRCGDGAGGVKPGEPGHDPAAVVDTRRRELEASCAILQVGQLELLGYPDSGMMGWSTNDAPGSFWSTPVPQAADRLAELIRKYAPDVVVTYDEQGFYGHPDHIQAHRITMAAIESTGIPAKVYWTTEPRSKTEKFMQIMRDEAAERGEPDPTVDFPEDGIGMPDEQITTWFDTMEFAGHKFDALAAHASQTDNAFFMGMGKARFAELMGVETFFRVHDNTGAPVPESDVFAGLR